jgi:hypothetical protein
MAATPPLGFLGLPAEIREIVYENIFPGETRYVIDDGELRDDLDTWEDKRNMFLTCKSIKREAIPYLSRMTIHLIYVGTKGPDLATIEPYLFPFVRCITFTGSPNYADIMPNGTLRWRYPRPMGGFIIRYLREYINLQEVIVAGNWIQIQSLQPQGESVVELTAPAGRRNNYLCAYVFTKLCELPPPPPHPTRTVTAVPARELRRTMAKPHRANSAGTGGRQFHITVVCDIDLHDFLGNLFKVVSVYPLTENNSCVFIFLVVISAN